MQKRTGAPLPPQVASAQPPDACRAAAARVASKASAVAAFACAGRGCGRRRDDARKVKKQETSVVNLWSGGSMVHMGLVMFRVYGLWTPPKNLYKSMVDVSGINRGLWWIYVELWDFGAFLMVKLGY